jgi:hypothetical protein
MARHVDVGVVPVLRLVLDVGDRDRDAALALPGALSISSNGVNSAMPFSACRFVMAAVSVVLPWSM